MSTRGFDRQSADEEQGIRRRDLLKTVTAAAAGLITVKAASEGMALAAQETPQKAQPAPAAAKSPLKYADVMKKAREMLYPFCRVCPECDGVACAGEVPGFGGVQSGSSFKNNYNSLAKINLKLKTFHDVKKPDMSVNFCGQKLAIPILGAPTAGTKYNMGTKLTEEQFISAVLGGCLAAGTLGSMGDGVAEGEDIYRERMKILTSFRGKSFCVVKPRLQDEMIKRIRMVEEAGGLVVGVDVDAAGRAARVTIPGQTVEPKTSEQLAELVKATKLPFIIKGIMTKEEAIMALDTGAAGIVVSNHGGRVLDHTKGVAEVLPEIADAVKGKMFILADGGVRYGGDVLKMLALGANAVLVGRPVIRGAYGGEKEGVAVILKKMQVELESAMVLTGTARMADVNRSILA
jgi:isopentenyl diphosphate isomerase/L-lactate dehydrogenase-like FMN-dependent dehydrogenase